jgi:hypothetical protein
VNDLADIPTPSEATWVTEWEFFEGSCDHQYWRRYFGADTWTIDTSSPDPVEVHLAGSQFSDGSINMRICLKGDTCGLEVDEALALAATLFRATLELERIEGGIR